jgi:hypothetical protein
MKEGILLKVCAIIADIVNSREIKNRRLFQDQLSKALQRLSHENEKIMSPYTITLGLLTSYLVTSPH